MQRASWKEFWFLIRHGFRYRPWVIGQFALMALGVGVGLLKPWPLKVIVDSVAGDQPFSLGPIGPGLATETLLFLSCFAYLLLHGGGGLVQFASTSVAALLSSRMVRDLRAEILWKLQKLSLRFHDDHRVGDLVHRVAFNTSAVETAFQSGFMGVVKSSLMVVGMFAVMFAINWKLTLIALAIVPFLLVSIRWYARRVQQVSRDHQDREGAVYTRLQEVLSSIRLILAFNQERNEQGRFEDACDQSVRARIRSALVQNGFGFVVALILALGTAFLYWFGIQEVLRDNLRIGEFLVFNAYLAMLYSPLSVLSYTASSVQSALGGGSRIFEILEADTEIEERPNARELDGIRDGVRFEAVTFGYDPAVPVLNAIDVEIRKGETLALVGETGGGKSTFLNLILRFYDPQEGRIAVDGTDLRDLGLDSLRREISFVPQECLLFCGTVRENIEYGKPGATEEEIRSAAKLAAAHGFIDEFPNGYETVVGERGVRVSQGQRQRIGLARAFLKPSSLLLLDEPTSALDAETESLLVRNLEEAWRDRTVVIVAHRLSTIRRADRIAVMHHGRIVEIGSHDELLAAEGHYHRLWTAQNTPDDTTVSTRS
jgi:ABC-type multidrug transport system fused ATPase/permease subunit